MSLKTKKQKFLLKKERFPIGRNLGKTQNPKNLIMGFLSTRQPEESETSPHGFQPQHESVRQFQTESKTKSF